jgi:DNA-binding transcriptional LysR family regulator
MILDDQRLRIFEAVARERSFTVAARKLGLTQPAVSQCIADLEKRTGSVLFDRQRGAVTLTPRGETFKLFADRILRHYEDLDVVFTDYEAFASVAEKLNSIKDEPSFHLFKDILSDKGL